MARPKRSGTVSYSESEKRWIVRLYVRNEVSGKLVRHRRYAKDKASAERKLQDLRNEAESGKVKTRSQTASMTVAEYVEHWRDSTLAASDRAAATKKMYERAIDFYILPSLDGERLETFNASQADAWLIRLSQLKGQRGNLLASGTRRAAFNCLSAALDGAVRDRLISLNPLRQVQRPSAQPAEPAEATSAKDVDRILEYVAQHDLRVKPLVYVVALTGCRIGEALGLRWADLDLGKKQVTIRRSSATTTTTKTKKARTISLLPEVVSVLRELKIRQAEERLAIGPGWKDKVGLVFTTASGEAIDTRNAQRDLRYVRKKLSISEKRPWHSLRHGLATRLLRNGMAAHDVQAILGHSSIRVTVDTYGHVDAAVSQEKLARALGRA